MTRSSSPWRAPGERKQRAEFVRGGTEPDVTLNDVTLGRETDKAIHVTVKELIAPVWMPLSQVKKMVRAGPGIAGKDSITITAWIAKQKGLA